MTVRAGAILLETTDAEGLARWYADALGLPAPRRTSDDHWGVALENTYLGFDRVPAPGGRGATWLWFAVDDVPAAHARLIAAGATEVRAPEACGEEVLSRLHDVEGNALGLVGPA